MHVTLARLLTVQFVSMMAVACSMAAFAQTPDPAKWSELQAKAKQEGQVVVAGPAFQGLRAALSEAFKARYGIELNYLGLNAGEVIARVPMN